MKFDIGGEIDSDHCTALKHEIFRCNDEFQRFSHYATIIVMKGRTPELSYKAYNAYSGFILHLYEFILGCHARDAGNTSITNKKGIDRTLIIEGYIKHHVHRILNSFRDQIKAGTAPDWVNDVSYYDETVPDSFVSDFREYRNKVCGHVAHERSSKLSLTEFYEKYHKYLHLLYRDSLAWWGPTEGEFPDLKEITDFTVWIERDRPNNGN